MHDVLFARHQRVRRPNHMELPLGVIPLLHDSDYFSLVVTHKLPDIRKTPIDVHIDRMQRDVFRILRHVYPNFHLDKIIMLSVKRSNNAYLHNKSQKF